MYFERLRWDLQTILAACVVCVIAGTNVVEAYAQPKDTDVTLRFEVASIKPTADQRTIGIIKRTPGERGYYGTNMSLLTYIRVAYQLRTSQISGPSWINSEVFDLNAAADKPSTANGLHIMLQHLLEDQFHMRLRHEVREQEGYLLVVDGNGSKLKSHDVNDNVLVPIMSDSRRYLGTNVTMAYLAFFLSEELDRTVVDKTGLDGHYDFDVSWVGDGSPTTTPIIRSSGGGIPALEINPVPQDISRVANALKQQLGLQLKSARVPTEHLVIEQIERLPKN